MSERYNRLFTLPAELYTEGSPLLIEAGALLKDNGTGRVIAQLKLKNLGEKVVRAVKLRLWTVSALGEAATAPVEYTYLDLNAARSAAFGAKNPIPIPDPTTRSFRAELRQAAFADGSLWNAPEGAAWTPMPEEQTVEAALGDAQLCKQLRLERGENCRFVPARHGELWRCACGEIVLGEACPACGKSFFEIDLPALTAAKDARLAEEKAVAEKAAAEAAERASIEAEKAAALAKEKAEKAEVAKAKLKKAGKVLGIAAAAVAVCVAAVLLITKVVIPNNRYKAAKELLEAGQYDDAISAFEALDGYKDSAEQINIAREAKTEAEYAAAYEQAEALFAAEDYNGAIAAFDALNGWRDSADRADAARAAQVEAINAAAYAEAEALLEAGDYDAAEEAFSALGEYSDASQMVLNTQEARRNSQYQSAVELLSKREYEDAYNIFVELGKYSDSEDKALNTAVLLAEEYKSSGEIDSAVEWYKKGGENDAAHEMEYEYITSHYDNTDELTYRYLTELTRLGYSDTQALYDKLYAVSFSAYINYSPSKSNGSQQNITRIPYSKGDPCFYYCFSGGYPGQTINVDFYEEASLGSNNVVSKKWCYADHHYGEVTVGEWCYFYFHNTGTNVYEHRITVYDTDSGETLGVYTVSTPFDHFR